jgi:hypothetical protein
LSIAAEIRLLIPFRLGLPSPARGAPVDDERVELRGGNQGSEGEQLLQGPEVEVHAGIMGLAARRSSRWRT